MPPLGWISPRDRTQAQKIAHANALAKMVKHNFSAMPIPAGPLKIMLTDFWKHPDVVADCGCEFDGFHQLTGSCVGASEGNAIFTTAAVQRVVGDNPTKAFIPWWPYPYGRTRYAEGDRGQGEGAVDSVMGQTLIKEGVFDINQPGLPKFQTDDGFYLDKHTELAWSDGGSSLVSKWVELGKKFPLGAAAVISSSQDIKASVVNGYAVLDGCDRFVGNGRIQGSGDSAYVVGHYDNDGGHSTCFLGYWDHPNDGPQFLYSNQWPRSTYPKDPAGAGRCCVWLPESEVDKLFHMGGNDGNTMAISHVASLPAQPRVMDWNSIWK